MVRQAVQRPPDARGFTLIELMITLVVLALLLRIAVPNMGSLLVSMRLTSSEQNLVSAMRVARAESARTNQMVQIQALNSDWRQGYSVVNAVTLQTVRTYPSMAPAQVVTTNATVLQFYPDGSAAAAGGIAMPATIKVCDPASNPVGRLISLNSAGFVVQGSTSAGYNPCP